jgi:predicted transposase/invertase (TIGR01784 family)
MAILPINEEILPPSDDYVLKAVLTHPNAKPALMDLISTVIGCEVKDVQIRNNELPAGNVDEKNERLDINCVIQDNSQVNVEVQGSRLAGLDGGHDSLMNKTIYYLTDLHSSKKSKSVKYVDLVRTYHITFISHNVFKWPDYVTDASLRTKKGVQVSDQINVIIIELSKLKDVLKKPVDEMTSLDMWSAFIGYASDPQQRKLINEVLDRKEAIGLAGTVLAEISKDEHERAKFLSRRKFETDMYNDMQTIRDIALKEGERIGEKKGEIKGEKKGIMKMARKLKESALMSVEQIAQISGLSIDEVNKL